MATRTGFDCDRPSRRVAFGDAPQDEAGDFFTRACAPSLGTTALLLKPQYPIRISTTFGTAFFMATSFDPNCLSTATSFLTSGEILGSGSNRSETRQPPGSLVSAPPSQLCTMPP